MVRIVDLPRRSWPPPSLLAPPRRHIPRVGVICRDRDSQGLQPARPVPSARPNLHHTPALVLRLPIRVRVRVGVEVRVRVRVRVTPLER